MTALPTLDEVKHLRHAQRPGHMYRTERGTVVINPAPTARAGVATAVLNPRRNARQAVVELLLHRGLLAEDERGQFTTTPAGQAVITAWETR